MSSTFAVSPEVLDSFRRLARTGCVEFLAETYSHSLASLSSKEDFMQQVALHTELMKKEFGVAPTAFRNTELIYSDRIGSDVAEMGFKTMLAEGARHVLGWKSPGYVYANALDQRLRLLLRNYKLSDDIAFRFSNRGWDQWPLTAEKYTGWLASDELEGDVVNLFMDYETFGEHQRADTGIFDFMKALVPAVLKREGLEFATVSEAAAKYQPVAVLHCPHVMSWADEERDITAWLGNELQNEAFGKLYALRDKIARLKDPDFDHVWNFMQASDHFYYMAIKWLSDGDVIGHAAGGDGVEARNGFQKLPLAAAGHAGHAQHLTGVDGKAHIIQTLDAQLIEHRQAVQHQTGRYVHRVRPVDVQADAVAHHHIRQGLLVGVLGGHVTDIFALAEHRHPVGDVQHLVAPDPFQ